MTKEIVTTVEVQSDPDQAWEVLIDFERWPDWNPDGRLHRASRGR